MSSSSPVSEVFQRIRGGLESRLKRVALVWATVGALSVLLLAWILAGPDGWPAGTATPLLLDALLLVLLGGIWWSSKRRIRSFLTERRIAGSMEKATGLADGILVGVLEFGRGLPEGVSGSLAAVATDSVARRLDLPDDRLGGSAAEAVGRSGRVALWTLAVVAPITLIPAIASPERAGAAWLGLAGPLGALATPALPALVVEPGDAEVLRGSDVVVTVHAPGRERVELHWQAGGDVARTRAEPVEGDGARFTLGDVRSPVEYRASAPDGAITPTFRIVPVDPLFVTDVRLDLAFPPHTGRPGEEYRGDVPPLTVPVGTRFDIAGRASRPLGEARLLSAEGETVLDLGVEGAGFGGSWWPGRSGTYLWGFAGADGGTTETIPTPLDLTLVRDSVPEVRIVSPGTDTVLPLDRRQPLALEARDDYGVRTLEIVAYRVTSLGQRLEPTTITLELGANRAVLARPVLDVSGWGLVPGDTVRYYARVVDNGPGGQGASTREYALWMPGAAELRRVAQRHMEDAGQEVEGLAELAAEAARDTRDLQLQTESGRSGQRSQGARDPEAGPEERVDFQEREALGRALEQQAEIQASIDSVRSRLERLSEAMREAGASDPELSDDLRELQELLADALTPEMREMLEDLRRDLEGTDAPGANETLEQLREQQETLRERLDEALGQFRRAAVEQDFRATTQEAEELAMQEQALAGAMREELEAEGLEARARQQDEIRERAGAMDERMERLEERLDALGENEAAEAVGEAREESTRAGQQMARAGEAARQGESAVAGERAEQAAGGLSETARQLQEARQRQARESMAAVQRALQTAADDALSLARRESDLGEAMSGASREDLVEMRGDVAAVQQGVRAIVENLSKAGGQAASDRALATVLGQAMSALGGTIDALEGGGQTPSRPSEASAGAVDALNRAALMAMAAAAQAGQGQSGQGQGDLQAMIESLAQQQGQLNNQAGQIMPMQLGPQGMQAQMQQLAQGQQGVADQLGQLTEDPGGNGGLGDLEALAAEAEALARELEAGRLDAPTRERQERLFHRLLDAGRGLEKDEFSEQRDASAPGDFARTQTLPLGPEALDAIRFQLPDAAELQHLSPAERRLVMQYFERLNREGLDADGVLEPEPDSGAVEPGRSP